MTKKKRERKRRRKGESEREWEKKQACCHFERERKYVAVGIPFTSRICLFNAAIKSDVPWEKFGILSLRHCGVSIGQTVTKENPADYLRSEQKTNGGWRLERSRCNRLKSYIKYQPHNLIHAYDSQLIWWKNALRCIWYNYLLI